MFWSPACFVFLEQAKISKLAAKVVIVNVLGTLHNIMVFKICTMGLWILTQEHVCIVPSKGTKKRQERKAFEDNMKTDHYEIVWYEITIKQPPSTNQIAHITYKFSI